MSNVKEWEDEIYSEIMDAYRAKIGMKSSIEFQETFVYKEIIKLMRELKSAYQGNMDELKDAVTNAMLLIVSLFLNERNDEDDIDHQRNFSLDDQKYLKKLFGHAIDYANGKAAAK